MSLDAFMLFILAVLMNRQQVESRLGKPRQKVQLVTNPWMTSHDSKGLNRCQPWCMKKLLLVAVLLVPTSVAAATEYDDPKYQNSIDCLYYLRIDPEITKYNDHLETKK